MVVTRPLQGSPAQGRLKALQEILTNGKVCTVLTGARLGTTAAAMCEAGVGAEARAEDLTNAIATVCIGVGAPAPAEGQIGTIAGDRSAAGAGVRAAKEGGKGIVTEQGERHVAQVKGIEDGRRIR